MSEATPTPPAPVVGTSRLEAFSDGIIAIAATLLVIELAAPSPVPTCGSTCTTSCRRSPPTR